MTSAPGPGGGFTDYLATIATSTTGAVDTVTRGATADAPPPREAAPGTDVRALRTGAKAANDESIPRLRGPGRPQLRVHHLPGLLQRRGVGHQRADAQEQGRRVPASRLSGTDVPARHQPGGPGRPGRRPARATTRTWSSTTSTTCTSSAIGSCWRSTAARSCRSPTSPSRRRRRSRWHPPADR